MKLEFDKNIYTLIVVSIVAFFPILFNGFTFYSDDNYVLNNPLIHSFSIENLILMFTTFFDGHYHPLTLLSFAINYFFSGESPFGYQLTNLMLNTTNGVLIYYLSKKILKENTHAFLVALIFIVHPIHVESVARITERKDMLFGLFFLASCITYIKFIETNLIKKYWLAVLFFVLSLLSKGQAVTLPLTLFLLSWYLIGYQLTIKKAVYFVPLIILSVIFGFLNIKAQVFTGYFLDTSSIPFANYFVSSAYVLTNYITHLFFPIQLSPHYPYPFDIYKLAPKFYFLYLLIFPVYLGLLFWFRKNKIVLFGLLFYIINIILMIRFIPVSENVMPDRYNYIPVFGIILILFYFINKFAKLKLTTIIYIIATLLSIKTFSQSMVWKNGISVWTTAYKYYPNDSEINQNLGANYLKLGNYQKAKRFIDLAIKLDSSNLLSHLDRSNYYIQNKDPKNSLIELKFIVDFNAKSVKDLSNQSSVYLTLGEFDKALEKINLAIKINDSNAKLFYNKAAILLQQNEYSKALLVLDQCLALRPSFKGDVHLLKSKLALCCNNLFLAQNELKLAKKYLKNSKEIENTKLAIENYSIHEGTLETLKDSKQLNAIGLNYFSLGFYQIALMYFDKSSELDSTYVPAIQNEVYSNYMLGNWSLTLEKYKKSQELKIEIDDKVKQQLHNLEMI